MSREGFKSDYPLDKSYRLSGGLLNRTAEVLNGLSNATPGTYNESYQGLISASAPPPAFLIGIARITVATNKPIYTCRFRWYSTVTSEWIEDTSEELELDAAAWYKPNPSGVDGSNAGTTKTLKVGDRCAAYWDPRRGYLIPILADTTTTATPVVEYYAAGPINPAQVSAFSLGDYRFAELMLETNASGTFQYAHGITWALPEDEDRVIWKDHRHGSALYTVGNGTQFRIRARTSAGYELQFTENRIVFTILGAYDIADGDSAANANLNTLQPTGTTLTGWTLNAIESNSGASPTITHSAGTFTFSAGTDTSSVWLIRVDYESVLGTTETSSSTSKSSTQSSRSSLSSSFSSPSTSSSSQSTSSSSKTNSASSQSASVSSSSSSSSRSTSSSSSNNSSSSSSSTGNCSRVTVVTGVACVAGNLVVTTCVLEVCGPGVTMTCT